MTEEEALDLLRSDGQDRQRKMLYHATCFVCAVRRVGRLLESMVAYSKCFKPEVAEVIKLEWKKKKTFFDSFIVPRNAIEHIDGEVNTQTQTCYFNLWHNVFVVATDKKVTINDAAMEKLLSAKNAIAEAIIQHYPEG